MRKYRPTDGLPMNDLTSQPCIRTTERFEHV